MREMIYGFFHGGDPREFFPDHECCDDREIANHRAACKLWDEAEARGKIPTPEACQSGWIYDDAGKPVAHILKSPYGIGTYYIGEDEDDDCPYGYCDRCHIESAERDESGERLCDHCREMTSTYRDPLIHP